MVNPVIEVIEQNITVSNTNTIDTITVVDDVVNVTVSNAVTDITISPLQINVDLIQGGGGGGGGYTTTNFNIDIVAFLRNSLADPYSVAMNGFSPSAYISTVPDLATGSLVVNTGQANSPVSTETFQGINLYITEHAITFPAGLFSAGPALSVIQGLGNSSEHSSIQRIWTTDVTTAGAIIVVSDLDSSTGITLSWTAIDPT